MISRISVVRAISMTPPRKGGRGGLDFFAPGGGFGGGWNWGNIIGSALEYIPRWLGTPEPGGFSDLPARLPQQLPVPVQSPPVVGFPYPGPYDIGPQSRGAKIARRWMGTTYGKKPPRRMHFCNQKALSRSIRRIRGFQHLVKRSHVFSTLTAHGPVHPHRRRKCQ